MMPAAGLRARGPRAWARCAAAIGFGLLVASASGCAAIGGVIGAAAEPKEKALYRLPNRATLVVVDDPAGALGDPALTSVLADEVGYNLLRARKITHLIPADRVHDLAAEFGPDFQKLSVASLGAHAGAEQVISVRVEDAQLQTEPGLLHPVVLCRVRVVGVREGRLFPAPETAAADDASLPTRGFPVTTTLFYRFSGEGDRGDLDAATHRLATRAGRDVARLFYRYRARTPGEPFGGN